MVPDTAATRSRIPTSPISSCDRTEVSNPVPSSAMVRHGWAVVAWLPPRVRAQLDTAAPRLWVNRRDLAMAQILEP